MARALDEETAAVRGGFESVEPPPGRVPLGVPGSEVIPAGSLVFQAVIPRINQPLCETATW